MRVFPGLPHLQTEGVGLGTRLHSCKGKQKKEVYGWRTINKGTKMVRHSDFVTNFFCHSKWPHLGSWLERRACTEVSIPGQQNMHFPKDLHCHWCLVGYVGNGSKCKGPVVSVKLILLTSINKRGLPSLSVTKQKPVKTGWLCTEGWRLTVTSLQWWTTFNTNNRTLALASISVLLLKYRIHGLISATRY